MPNSIYRSPALWGAVIGALSLTWSFVQSYVLKRVRLKVVPKFAQVRYSDVLTPKLAFDVLTSKQDFLEGDHFCIEVVNLSSFKVTVTQVGFRLPGGKVASATALWLGERQLPRRLEGHESCMVFFDRSAIPANIGKAFARTDCGARRHGSSPALKLLKQQIAEA